MLRSMCLERTQMLRSMWRLSPRPLPLIALSRSIGGSASAPLEKTWDAIVVGSGPAACSWVQTWLRERPLSTVLVVERGPACLTDILTERRPWILWRDTSKILGTRYPLTEHIFLPLDIRDIMLLDRFYQTAHSMLFQHSFLYYVSPSIMLRS